MTPEQHNKYLGIAHLFHGGFNIVLTVLIMTFMTIMMSSDPHPPPGGFFAFLWIVVVGMTAVMTSPAFIAGYALLKRKKWAKTAAIVSAVFSATSAPIGTGICAYTFWFLFSEQGKRLYDPAPLGLPPASVNWNVNATRPREAAYVPPSSPPDWR